ncbi:MAG: hypothetical protein PWR16_1311, partial [Methanoculleus sp.]|nr:hypothetical protein [Methanoculleus sp.]
MCKRIRPEIPPTNPVHWTVGTAHLAVLELLPFGQSLIAIGGGADGECDVPEERSSTTVRWG